MLSGRTMFCNESQPRNICLVKLSNDDGSFTVLSRFEPRSNYSGRLVPEKTTLVVTGKCIIFVLAKRREPINTGLSPLFFGHSLLYMCVFEVLLLLGDRLTNVGESPRTIFQLRQPLGRLLASGGYFTSTLRVVPSE